MDKTLIKKASYSAQASMLIVEFKDGTKYGETGEIAKKTLAQLHDNDVKVFEVQLRPKKVLKPNI